MTFLRSRANRIRMLALLALAAGTLCACAPEPVPTPTPTAAFATEEEAFAAAEEVYRAYNDAVNSQRENGSEANPQDYLTGLALESDIDANRTLEQNAIQIEGDGEVLSVRGNDVNLTSSPGQVSADVCLDVSSTRVLNSQGVDVTPKDRASVIALSVEFIVDGDTILIAASAENSVAEC
ncbi:hypothetical protein [Microbacterium sp. A93]|uniref:hypothetical protein n=1 Tax=Microbacterium sp. A93 TaxID=3450716 RepID=UPI003F430C35